MNSDRDKTTPYPGSPGPLSPGRTDLNPDREPGIDELPGNEGEIPLEPNDETVVEREQIDMDPDRQAELDDQPNPR
ncbi:hypothetical protein [Azotobacter salinestris]|uniref:hypothetical protein n=1 Tax=Azotobacter salinestris TaxID=69964 RepID=UPI001266A693|nr:hypothetical protein [Azotobacter salinestris]